MKKFLAIVFLVAAAAAAGWYFGQQGHSHNSVEPGGRKVAFYQSPMHPWIKSDKPGNCTICGMKLTPVYEGEKGIDIEGNVVTLSSNSINVLNVQTETAQMRSIERKLIVAGRIEAQETRYRMLSAYVDGRVEKLHINFVGAEVEPGQPLAMLYSPTLLTAEREYLNASSQHLPELSTEQGRLVEGARLRLKRLGLTDQQIAEIPHSGATNLSTQIVAPIGGTVISRAVVEGQYVKEGDKLFEIADLSQMWFRFDVYEQDLPSVRLGEVVRVTSPALGGKVFEGPVTFIDPNINEMSRSARVRVDLTNELVAENGRSRSLLYNGLYASGTILLRSEPVLTVSRSAVLDPGDQPRVYIDKTGGAYEQRPVGLGIRGERFVEIRSGLNSGERVVSAGNLLLDSQSQINQSAHVEPGVVQATISSSATNSASEFLSLANKISEALASDNRESFNQLIVSLPGAAQTLKQAFAETPHLADLATAVAANSDLKAAQNLVIARSEFLPFSLAVSEFTQALRKHTGAADVKVFKCPMYPEPGKTAYWIQAGGPLRNPFFGSEMLDCGQEVK